MAPSGTEAIKAVTYGGEGSAGSIHILRVPTHIHHRKSLGYRWCFRCRKRRLFVQFTHVPDDPMSYYGAHYTVSCLSGHDDGDLFPGRYREWET